MAGLKNCVGVLSVSFEGALNSTISTTVSPWPNLRASALELADCEPPTARPHSSIHMAVAFERGGVYILLSTSLDSSR